MTEIANRMAPMNIIGAPSQHNDLKDSQSYIPELIEENRTDPVTGKTECFKFSRGKLLGKGGFGRCYVGTLMSTKAVYALKIVPKSTLVKSKAKQKLQSEIRIQRNLRHVNIVRFERYFEDHHNVYIVLELCCNNSMSELLKRRKKLLEAEVRFYLHQLVESLKYLHQALIIHRDLKLGNLFIDSNMRIKVGDFGLATKLAHMDERKRTICGTPNYLAPEILEGKDGHSFEVDIWSTGVVMYTLLVGKPPFESKDVKTTYKRILTNSYSFPEHTIVSEDARSLIKNMLQHRPDRRPSLDDILSHPFFTSPSAYHPTILPEVALREVPTLVPPLSNKSGGYSKDKLKSLFAATNVGAVYGGDENDAGAINRISNMPVENNMPKSIAAKSSRLTSQSNVLTQIDAQKQTKSTRSSGTVQTITAATLMAAVTDQDDDMQNNNAKKQQPARAHGSIGQARLDRARPLGEKTLKSSIGQSLGNSVPFVQKASKSSSSTNAPSSSKFEVYDDLVHSTNAMDRQTSPKTGNTMKSTGDRYNKDESFKRSSNSHTQSKVDSYHQKYLTTSGSGINKPTGGSNVKYDSDDDDTVDDLQQQLVDMNISHSNKVISAGNNSSGSSGLLRRPPANQIASSSTPSNVKTSSHDQENTPLQSSEKTDGIKTGKDDLLTPAITQSNKEPKGTLEEMHEMLDQSYINNTHFQMNQKNIMNDIENERESYSVKRQINAPKVWVVRYVDYTSKYGLGFLLNTGSAGVYFNDSTKIILSPDGNVFQYVERVRKSKDNSSGKANGVADSYHIQTHLVTAYPIELQKKVTLLRHFRNYLVEQQKLCSMNTANSNNGNNDSDPHVRLEDIYGGPAAGDEVKSLPMLSDPNLVVGANAMIKFGVSSAVYRPKADKDDMMNSNGDVAMPYIKKWVRTKHAILFRMSNRTVQVLFFDKSEILLSSEAHIVTYVNKQSVRSEHSLDEVMQTGRTDIAKRLRYTKDIMYRLIHLQTK